MAKLLMIKTVEEYDSIVNYLESKLQLKIYGCQEIRNYKESVGI